MHSALECFLFSSLNVLRLCALTSSLETDWYHQPAELSLNKHSMQCVKCCAKAFQISRPIYIIQISLLVLSVVA